ncbi:MAG: glycosyltransferase family 2 protein [Bacteroidia bacterium]
MQLPKISIVTTSFNQGIYLEETILSVISQGYPNLEYIIIDGGSTDNSIEIIKKYESKLAYWVSEKDNGMYHGLQKGFEKSTGEIMAWINSDDRYHTKSFFVVGEIFSNFPQVQWLQGLPSLIDEAGRIVSTFDFRRWSKYEFLIGEYKWIQQESCFWRRALWEKAGGKLNTTLLYAGDFDLWLNFFSHAELYCVNTIIGAFRARSKNQFSVEKISEYENEAEHLLELRLKNLSRDEKKRLIKLSLYKHFISKIPMLKNIGHKIFFRGMYPPRILFDRLSQSFIIK